MTLATNNYPQIIEGPIGEQPDPTQCNLGTIFIPDGTAEIHVVQLSGGVHVWTTLGTGTLAINNVHSNFLSGAGTTASPLIFLLPNNVEIWVDPVAGNNNNNGTVGSPVQTLTEALLRIAPGWTGKCRIHLNPGTYALGASPKLVFPAPPGGVAAEPLVIDGLGTTDSGLGTLTVGVGSTQGAAPVFGTVVDSVGGFTVNAFRGKLLRFTSGALSGNSYWIFSNSASVITIVTQFASAPVAGATYVIEDSAQLFTWSGTLELEGRGTTLGLYNLTFSTSGSIDLRGSFDIYASKVRWNNTQITINQGVGIALLSPFSQQWPSGSLPVVTTSFLGPQFSGGSLFPTQNSRVNLSFSFMNACKTAMAQQCFFSLVDSGAFGAAAISAINQGCSLSITRVTMDTITPVTFNVQNPRANGAAVVIANGSSALIADTLIQNTPNTTAPGDAILITDHSVATVENVSGTGNAGVGVRCNFHSMLAAAAHGSSSSVTGTGGDVSLGATGVLAWAAVNAGLQTDAAQQCISTNGN